MLPKLYTLDKIPAIGHLRQVVPSDINCPECNRETETYEDIEFVLDVWPDCDFVAATGGAYFISERLLTYFQKIGIRGYIHKPVKIGLSEDFYRSHSESVNLVPELPVFRYFIITGRCDGPWLSHTRGGVCSICGQHKAELTNFNTWMAEIEGNLPQEPRQVFSETWQGEDIFTVTEPGAPFITERVANILADTGNLRQEEVKDKEKVQRLLPKYAIELEKKGWQVEKCIKLSSAKWVND